MKISAMIVLNFDFLRGRFIFFVQFLTSVFLNWIFLVYTILKLITKTKTQKFFSKIIYETNWNKAKWDNKFIKNWFKKMSEISEKNLNLKLIKYQLYDFFFINLYIYLPSLSVSNFIVYVITVSTVSYVLRKNCNATLSVCNKQRKKEKTKQIKIKWKKTPSNNKN